MKQCADSDERPDDGTWAGGRVFAVPISGGRGRVAGRAAGVQRGGNPRRAHRARHADRDPLSKRLGALLRGARVSRLVKGTSRIKLQRLAARWVAPRHGVRRLFGIHASVPRR